MTNVRLFSAIFLALMTLPLLAAAPADPLRRILPNEPRSRYNITIPIGPPIIMEKLPQIYGPPGRPLVVIDAGHGGHDPGAISPFNGASEKALTLNIAKKLRDTLLASGRVRVALTRDDDHFIALQRRYEIGRQLGAALFISIHADSAANPQARGASIYTLSESASDKEAANLAARENRADIVHGINLGGASDTVSSILIDLSMRETMAASSQFADMLHREAAEKIPFRSQHHHFASLIVLKAPDMPSVLFETGYLSNEADVKFLFSSGGSSDIATSTAQAIETYLARRTVAF